jgi:solute carrier family 8 (sodium/calcium exchanger)
MLLDMCPDPVRGPGPCEFVEPSICCPGGGGTALPLLQGETDWHPIARGALYLFFLGWLFIGVAIVSDIFMGAIEEITAAKKESYRIIDGVKRRYMAPVWNFTVANLTLMALGSSAPEILLSVVELLSNRFYSGQLGASTIVGSAAFNLFSITAVCILAIPEGEVRYIQETSVYAITLTFSIFAYLWILICLQLWTPEIITLEEAILTFAFFPILIFIAYLADIGKINFHFEDCGSKRVHPEEQYTADDPNREAVAAKLQDKYKHHEGTGKTLERLITHHHEHMHKKSRAYYRVAAVRGLTGGERVDDKRRGSKDHIQSSSKQENHPDDDPSTQVVEFTAKHHSCLESDPEIVVELTRAGPVAGKLNVSWKTREGTAKDGEDFHAAEGVATFNAGEHTTTIAVKLIDDDEHEPDKEFYVDLSNPECAEGGKCRLGEFNYAEITVIDDDEPGVLQFTEDDFHVEVGENKGTVWVMRKDGCSANVSCKYKCEPGSAKPGKHYEDVSGTLEFKKGDIKKSIDVPVLNGGGGNALQFSVIIEEAEGGATFHAETDGGEESCVARIIIGTGVPTTNDVDKSSKLEKLKTVFNDFTEDHLGKESWKEQFTAAVYINGSYEDQKDASAADWVSHVLSLPFKLLFALTPPPAIAGGYPAFYISLAFIGLLTAVVGDAASMFGCVLGVPDEITAITFVALGTSLPDTFASRTAAVEEPYADASVGNVTGSNSVNVFLGLGLAWLIGTGYWGTVGATDEWKSRYVSFEIMGGARSENCPLPLGSPARGPNCVPDLFQGGAFVVSAGSLAFSVAVYTGLAVFGCSLLLYRRLTIGGELGGGGIKKRIHAFIFFSLWLAYVGANIGYFVVDTA